MVGVLIAHRRIFLFHVVTVDNVIFTVICRTAEYGLRFFRFRIVIVDDPAVLHISVVSTCFHNTVVSSCFRNTCISISSIIVMCERAHDTEVIDAAAEVVEQRVVESADVVTVAV